MATICCPNCQTEIRKPTNVIAWIFGSILALVVVGFFAIIICLAAITAVGADANAGTTNVSSPSRINQVPTTEFERERQNFSAAQ